MRHLLFAVIVSAIVTPAVFGEDAAATVATTKQVETVSVKSATDGANDARHMLQTSWDAVIKALSNPALDRLAKEAEVERVVIPLIDFDVMSKLALGKKSWKMMTADQRKRYQELFVKRLKNSYRTKIARYSGQDAKVKPALPPKTKPGSKAAKAKKRSTNTKLYFPVELISTEGSVAILHKVRKVGSQWMIYDTEIEGVSFLMTYRSQFTDILSAGTVEDLLTRLAEPQSE